MANAVEPAGAEDTDRPSRAWYALTAIPGITAIVLIVRSLSGLFDGVEQMQRFVVPGEHEVELAAGSHDVYAETESLVDGVVYRIPSFSLRCRIVDRGTAPAAELVSPRGTASYAMGAYAGEKMFELRVDRAGIHRLSCEGDQRGVLAIGEPFAWWNLAWIILAAVLALPMTGVIGYLVHRARHKPR